MAISRKLPSSKNGLLISKEKENKITELINKGGKVSLKNKEVKVIKGVQLRLPQELIIRIDESRSKNYGVSRHSWISQAITEKLKKEET